MLAKGGVTAAEVTHTASRSAFSVQSDSNYFDGCETSLGNIQRNVLNEKQFRKPVLAHSNLKIRPMAVV
jgi:hypothetical protein